MPARDMHDLKKMFGDEYPDAVNLLGMRLPLVREGRFLRQYYSEEKRHASVVSKFEDGSASITLDELRGQWPTWAESEKREFLNASQGLQGQGDYPDILRFLMDRGGFEVWSALALQAAGWLPRDEAFGLLARALAAVESHSANITQGIAATRHPDALGLLDAHLESLWSHPDLWDDDPFVNWRAYDAICCIEHLIQLGVSTDKYQDRARALSAHASAGTRESCGAHLGRHYDWLPKPDPGQRFP